VVGPLNDDGLRLAIALLKMAGGRVTIQKKDLLMQEPDYWIERLDDPYHDAIHYRLKKGGEDMVYVSEMGECPWCNRPMPEGFMHHSCDDPEQDVVLDTSEMLGDAEAEQFRCSPYEARIVSVSGYQFEGWHLWAAVLVAVLAIFGLSRLFR